MWSKRKNIDLRVVPTLPNAPPVITTPAYTQQQANPAARAALELKDEEFHFISSLAYTLVPELSSTDVHALLPWVMDRWLPSSEEAAATLMSTLATDATVCQSLSQVEYFLAGTNNGHVFAVPLVPAHFLRAVVERCPDGVPALSSQLQLSADMAARLPVPVNATSKRLLHRHVCEEPVIALDHCGSLVASAASTDPAVAVSMFYPKPVPITLIPHGRCVRSLKLWEGRVFEAKAKTAAVSMPTSPMNARTSCVTEVAARRRWGRDVEAIEPAAVYLFTGEEVDPVVRLFRIDVIAGTYTLLHVFVVTTNLTGLRTPLDVLDREDSAKAVTKRTTECAVHCLAIDDDKRLLAGTEGGVCVWALPDLPYTYTMLNEGATHSTTTQGNTARVSGDILASSLSWDVEAKSPLSGALLSCPAYAPGDGTLSSGAADACAFAARCLRRRASRLVNRHVWLRDAGRLKQALSQSSPAGVSVKKERSKWKPRYASTIAGGLAVGVVSNEVATPLEATASAAEVLEATVVTVSFDGGEVRNDVHVPLCCVQPVVYPLCWLRMAGNACFALQVLKPSGRLVTSGSDGLVGVWFWQGAGPEERKVGDGTEDTYLPYLVAGKSLRGRRGIGRHVCIMRSPDVFLSCGYDDGIVREWHVYDEPERMLRCERRFSMMPATDASKLFSGGTDLSGKNLFRLVNQMVVHPNKADKSKAAAASKARKASEKAQSGGDDGGDSSSSSDGSDSSDGEDDEMEGGDGTKASDGVTGISNAVAFPPFSAMFLVGVFEPTIQTFSLAEVQGCEAPPDYIYNGVKTVKVPPEALTAPTDFSL